MHICLLTDFGTRDPYVASMKGVLAARTSAPLFDLTHEIAPFDVLEGAWFLRTAARWWPTSTIFIAVVDPGVGSERKIIAARIEQKIFLAPDNGLLTFVIGAGAELRSVENGDLFLPGQSTTFQGRDRFAPVAAALANGLPLEEVGPKIESIVRLDYQPPQCGEESARGSIVAIDRFGNLITDIERSRLPFDHFELRIGGLTIDRLEGNYAGAGPGPFLIIGSSGFVEISVTNGSAAERLGVNRLDRVEVWKRRAL